MKRCFLYIILLTIIIGFSALPEIGLAEVDPEEIIKNQDKIELNKKDAKLIFLSLKQELKDELIKLPSPEEQAVLLIMSQAVKVDTMRYLLIDVPKEIGKALINTTIKVVSLILAKDPSLIIAEIEKLTVQEAKNYLMNWLLQNEIRVGKGNLKEFSYPTYNGGWQKVIFPYIIAYRPLSANSGEVAINIYSSKTIKTPALRANFQWEGGIEELSPFIVKVNGKVEKVEIAWGFYYEWVEGPKIEVVFDEPVPDLGFKEPDFFDKLKNRLNEVEIVFKKAVEMITDIFDRINPFQASLVPVASEKLVSEMPEIDISKINLENLLPIAEKIEEVKEKLSAEPKKIIESEKTIEEKEGAAGRTSEINLEEIQKILDEISQEIEKIALSIQKLVQEQGIDLLEGGFIGQGIGQDGGGQQVIFSTGPPISRTQGTEPVPGPEPDVGAGSPSPEEEGEETSPLQPEAEPEPEPEGTEDEEEEEKTDLEPEPEPEPEPDVGAGSPSPGDEETSPLQPEIVFELEPVQTTLVFGLSWTATYPMDSVTPSGIDGFYLKYQIPGLETTSPSNEDGIALWYQDESQEWQDWSIGEILELGSDKENLLVLGQDGYTYNFKLQAKDKVGNFSQWQEAFTTITIPEQEPPVVFEPVWPMFQHDAQHTGRSPFIGPAISSEPELSILIEGEGLGPAVIGSDRTIYLKTGQGLAAFNYDISQKWVYELSSLYGTPGLWEPDKVVYVFSQDEGISAIDIRDGSLKWKKEYNILLNQNPIIGDNGKIYFIIEDSGLIVLNKNGEQEWIYDFGPVSGSVSNLAVDQEGTVYFGHGDTLFAVNSQGEKWQRTFEEKCNYYHCAPEVREIAIADDRTIYVLVAWESDFVSMTDADRLNCIHALNPEDPSEEQEKWSTCWRFSLIPVPISSQSNIYLSVSWLDFSASLRTRIVGYDAQGNSIANWQSPTNWGGIGWVGSMILDEEENLYALLSYYDNTVKALSPNGEEKWSIVLDKGTGSMFSLILGKDNDLFISTAKKLFVIK